GRALEVVDQLVDVEAEVAADGVPAHASLAVPAAQCLGVHVETSRSSSGRLQPSFDRGNGVAVGHGDAPWSDSGEIAPRRATPGRIRFGRPRATWVRASGLWPSDTGLRPLPPGLGHPPRFHASAVGAVAPLTDQGDRVIITRLLFLVKCWSIRCRA